LSTTPCLIIITPGIDSQLASPNGHVRKPWLAPLAPGVLGAMAPSKWRVIAWDEFVQGQVPPALIRQSQLVGLSGLTPSRYRAQRIAKIATGYNVPLVAGGRDVIGWSREPNGIEEMHRYYPSICASLVNPELMQQMLDDCLSGQLQPVYSLQSEANIELVAPRRDLLDPSWYFAGNTLFSSVGCPFCCDWCTVGGRGMSFKTGAVLQAEVEALRGRFFIDVADSIAGNPDFFTEVVLPIYRASGMQWGAEAAVCDILRSGSEGSLIPLMAQSGCRLLYIGIESITEHVHRNKSSRDMAEQLIRECRRHGIIVIGSFMLDATGRETSADILETCMWAQSQVDFAQFNLSAALPGCTLRRRAQRQGKIISDNWEDYDGAHPTIAHPLLGPELRSRLLERCYTDFGRIDHVVRRTLRAPWPWKAVVFAAGRRYQRGIPRA